MSIENSPAIWDDYPLSNRLFGEVPQLEIDYATNTLQEKPLLEKESDVPSKIHSVPGKGWERAAWTFTIILTVISAGYVCSELGSFLTDTLRKVP